MWGETPGLTRERVAVFNWCYHGTVDETFITLDEHGVSKPRRGNVDRPSTELSVASTH